MWRKKVRQRRRTGRGSQDVVGGTAFTSTIVGVVTHRPRICTRAKGQGSNVSQVNQPGDGHTRSAFSSRRWPCLSLHCQLGSPLWGQGSRDVWPRGRFIHSFRFRNVFNVIEAAYLIGLTLKLCYFNLTLKGWRSKFTCLRRPRDPCCSFFFWNWSFWMKWCD